MAHYHYCVAFGPNQHAFGGPAYRDSGFTALIESGRLVLVPAFGSSGSTRLAPVLFDGCGEFDGGVPLGVLWLQAPSASNKAATTLAAMVSFMWRSAQAEADPRARVSLPPRIHPAYLFRPEVASRESQADSPAGSPPKDLRPRVRSRSVQSWAQGYTAPFNSGVSWDPRPA